MLRARPIRARGDELVNCMWTRPYSAKVARRQIGRGLRANRRPGFIRTEDKQDKEISSPPPPPPPPSSSIPKVGGSKGTKTFNGKVVDAQQLSYEPVPVDDQPPVPHLAHNLDRVLFDPGVHFLKDPRTEVYNFTPFLEKIMSIRDFDFDYIAKYVPSGKDSKLATLAQEKGKRFVGSSSSLTGVLTQFHHVLSHFRPPLTVDVSKHFPGSTTSFTTAQTRPVSLFLRYNSRTNTYAVDADKAENRDIILSILGNCLETMLTTPERQFRNYHKSRSHLLDPSLKNSSQQSTYHYTSCGEFLMRSQLDCFDERLPGTGVFDLKTRAVCAVRHDLDYVQVNDGSNYQIRSLEGTWESFSREWYELIRSTMLKYSLQARIGRMDGIFIAYHNVRQMFGFQYVPLSDMDRIFHTVRSKKNPDAMSVENAISGKPPAAPKPVPESLQGQVASHIADSEFRLSMELFEHTLNELISHHQGDQQQLSYNLVFEAKQAGTMIIYAKPMLDKDINHIQTTNTEAPGDPRPANDPKYKPNRDPHRIWKHAETDLENIPKDVAVFKLETRNIIDNNLPVPLDEYPTMDNLNARWRVKWKISKPTGAEAAQLYKETFKDHPSVLRPIVSEPLLERIDESEERDRRTKLLSEIAPPNPLQTKLRQLSSQGARSHKKRHSKDKIIWTPKKI
jgi:hypothetical protein